MSDTTLRTGTFEELVERRVTLKQDLEYIQAELEQIDDQIRAKGVGTHEAGAWTVQVRANRRLDTARFEAAYPVAQYPHLYKRAINTEAAKHDIAASTLDEFYTEGRPAVVIR